MRPSVKEVKSFIVFHNHVNVMIYSALSSADDPLVIIQLMIAENFLLYIEKKICSAPGRDRSKGGFSAPERIKFSLYIEKKICSAFRRISSKGGFSPLERRKFSPLYREDNRLRARAR